MNHRQRGSVAVMTAICLIAAVAALGALDVGLYFFARRDLQRTADLAAVAGAQLIGGAGACASATNASKANAAVNGASADNVAVTCGRWDPSANAGPSYFVASGTPLNAVQVSVQRNVPYLFLAVNTTHTLSASATAVTANVASFSLASSVASLSGGTLNGLLNGLLGANLNLDVASYQGLAAAQIRLGDLAAALGVGSVTELLGTKVTVSQLATAMATVLSKNGAAGSVAVSALGWIASAATNSTPISIGASSDGRNGLITVGLSSPEAGANVTIGALDALLIAAELADGSSAINLGNALNLGALANITAQARVLSPAVIAIGEAGYDASGNPRTSAHSASIRLYLSIQLLNLDLGIIKVSALNLPISIEAGAGTAVLQSAVCGASKSSSYSVIAAQPTPASVCIGGDAISNMSNTTTPGTCNTPVAITSVTVATGLLAPITLDVVVGNPATNSGLSIALKANNPAALTFDGIAGNSDDYQSTNTNALGSATSGLLSQVAAQLPYAVHANLNGVPLLDAVLQVLVAPVLSILVALLTPVLNALDALLVPVLNLLGVQIGVVTVHDLGLACGEAGLVY